MPLIAIHGIEGVFSPEQKAGAIRKVTDAMISIEGEAMRRVTWVRFEEAKSGDWGFGGLTRTAQDIKRLQDGKSWQVTAKRNEGEKVIRSPFPAA